MEFSFYHITDSHYFSKKNYDASPWETPRYNDQLTIRESEELLKGALDIVKADGDAKSVFLTGDITERGDIDSLNECYALLSEYDRELSVYAFLDTHDYFSDAAVTRFDAEGKRYGVKIDNEPEKNSVRNAFKKFGTEKAKYVYTDGFTCFIEVSAGIYYIQLRNYENEKGFRVFDDAMIDWVVEKAEKLKKQGAFMFAGVHIPVMTPSPIYIILGNGSVPVNGEEIAERFADAGISFIISGHSHIHSIRRRVSKKGCVCYEIGTGSLGGYPGKIRKITIDTEQNKVTVKSLYVNPCELKLGKSVSEYGKEIFTESISPVFYNMEHNVEELLKTGGGVKFPEKAILKHKKLIMKMGKKINGLTFGKIGDLIRFETGLKKSEYESIRDKKLTLAFLEMITGLYSGEQGFTPYSPEYKILTSYVSAADSIVKILPVDIKKLTGYPDIYSVVEPLIYRGENDCITFFADAKPEEKQAPYRYKSHTGAKLIAAAALPFFAAAAVGFSVLYVLNHAKVRLKT